MSTSLGIACCASTFILAAMLLADDCVVAIRSNWKWLPFWCYAEWDDDDVAGWPMATLAAAEVPLA